MVLSNLKSFQLCHCVDNIYEIIIDNNNNNNNIPETEMFIFHHSIAYRKQIYVCIDADWWHAFSFTSIYHIRPFNQTFRRMLRKQKCNISHLWAPIWMNENGDGTMSFSPFLTHTQALPRSLIHFELFWGIFWGSYALYRKN